MSGEISTIQSLKAVDAWIDVINANINGGVRTAFKSSRLKFSGSNTDVDRPGNTTSLPLQFPESSLTTANTVIDFSQGAITASTENTHLAIQGEGFFAVCDPGSIAASGSGSNLATSRMYLTRDGEFHTNQDGLLVTSYGYLLCIGWNSGLSNTWNPARAVYNDIDGPAITSGPVNAVRLSSLLTGTIGPPQTLAGGGATAGPSTSWTPLVLVTGGKQSLAYTSFGSTVFDAGWRGGSSSPGQGVTIASTTPSDCTILAKSLEASNSSMTQSVPELSLAQKLFSALTKVLQTKQTNVDGVLNLVR